MVTPPSGALSSIATHVRKKKELILGLDRDGESRANWGKEMT